MMPDSSLTDEKPRLYLPMGANTDPAHPHKYIFVACGSTAVEGHFSELLKNALVNAGLAVKIGYKGQHYPELLAAIRICTTVVLVYGARFFDTDLHLRSAIGVHAVAPLEALPCVRPMQWHSSRVFSPLTGSHCKLRPNTVKDCTGGRSAVSLSNVARISRS
jgi:hypothetical protein